MRSGLAVDLRSSFYEETVAQIAQAWTFAVPDVPWLTIPTVYVVLLSARLSSLAVTVAVFSWKPPLRTLVPDGQCAEHR